jgi:hypothetical protein
MFGALPGHPQPAQGQANRFVADQPRGQPLGETDLGGPCERPPTRRLAERPWTLVQQGPQGLAGPSIEDDRQGMRSRRLRLQRCEAALLKGVNGIAHSLVGAVQVAGNRGRRLALGTGEEDLAAAYGKGGRGPKTGLQGGPLVRRERAYIQWCLHTQQYTTCPKTSIGSALGAHDRGADREGHDESSDWRAVGNGAAGQA